MPMQEGLKRVVSSSYEFLEKMPQTVPSGFEIATIDIKNLYPSIDTDHLLEVLCSDVIASYGNCNKARFIVGVLQVVLRNQFILHRGEAYQAFGIATGIPPGVFPSQSLCQSCWCPCARKALSTNSILCKAGWRLSGLCFWHWVYTTDTKLMATWIDLGSCEPWRTPTQSRDASCFFGCPTLSLQWGYALGSVQEATKQLPICS